MQKIVDDGLYVSTVCVKAIQIFGKQTGPLCNEKNLMAVFIHLEKLFFDNIETKTYLKRSNYFLNFQHLYLSVGHLLRALVDIRISQIEGRHRFVSFICSLLNIYPIKHDQDPNTITSIHKNYEKPKNLNSFTSVPISFVSFSNRFRSVDESNLSEALVSHSNSISRMLAKQHALSLPEEISTLLLKNSLQVENSFNPMFNDKKTHDFAKYILGFPEMNNIKSDWDSKAQKFLQEFIKEDKPYDDIFTGPYFNFLADYACIKCMTFMNMILESQHHFITTNLIPPKKKLELKCGQIKKLATVGKGSTTFGQIAVPYRNIGAIVKIITHSTQCQLSTTKLHVLFESCKHPKSINVKIPKIGTPSGETADDSLWSLDNNDNSWFRVRLLAFITLLISFPNLIPLSFHSL